MAADEMPKEEKKATERLGLAEMEKRRGRRPANENEKHETVIERSILSVFSGFCIVFFF